MVGTWRWNVGLGLVGALLTILFSLGKNPLTVLLMRSMYAFIAFVIIAFILRAVLAFILRPPAITDIESTEDEEGKGTKLDFSTPDESEDINQMLKSQMDEGNHSSNEQAEQQKDFRPLNPPQLLSAQNKEPEELAKVIRHMTGG